MTHLLLLARHSTDEEIYQSNSGSDQDTSNIIELTIKTTNNSYTSTSTVVVNPELVAVATAFHRQMMSAPARVAPALQ